MKTVEEARSETGPVRSLASFGVAVMGFGCAWARVPGEKGGATGAGEGRPAAAAPRDGEGDGEVAAARAEGRAASRPRTCSCPSGARG
jgi:hypothetical protein